jgi:hypothetical protein
MVRGLVERARITCLRRPVYLIYLRLRARMFRGTARSLLQSKYPDKVQDLKLDLIKVANESDPEVISRISDELRGLS